MTPPVPEPATVPIPVTGRRLIGVDAARSLALIGMFAAHTLPLEGRDGSVTTAGLLADGKPSALFAVLAGVGIALSTGGRRRPPDGRAHLAAAAGLLVRAVLVGLLGLALASLDPPAEVILAYYGLLFVVAIPLLRLPAWLLGACAALACALTPVLSMLLRQGVPVVVPPQPGLAALASPVHLVGTLALTGIYPVLTWTTYLLAGMAVGRLDLTSARIAGWLLAGGVVLAVAASVASALLLRAGGAAAIGRAALAVNRYGITPTDTWWWLAVDSPHSGAPLDLALTTGTALAVLGAMLLLARCAAPMSALPAAVGAVPLTIYTLHVLALAAYPDTGTALWLSHVAGAVVVGVAVRLAGRRGPLEGTVSAASRAARAAVARPRLAPTGR